MTVPAFQSSAFFWNDGGPAANTITIDKPSGAVENDILLALLHGASKNITGLPSGFVGGPAIQIGSTYIQTFYKLLTAAEPGNYTFTYTGTTLAWGVIVRYAGSIDLVTPKDAEAASGANSAVAPSVTTTRDSIRVIRLYAAESLDEPVTPSDIYPAGTTGRFVHEGATFGTMAVADEVQAVAGATGTETFLPDTPSAPYASLTFAIKSTRAVGAGAIIIG